MTPSFTRDASDAAAKSGRDAEVHLALYGDESYSGNAATKSRHDAQVHDEPYTLLFKLWVAATVSHRTIGSGCKVGREAAPRFTPFEVTLLRGSPQVTLGS